ncbi:hypothetical protein Mapa_008980 [Marchantia paleacea]|nr:hypothetical protein Mapa_008980 [Marchantia paleacea]
MASRDEVRDENVNTAMVAELAERYEDMMDAMEKVARAFNMDELTDVERNLLSVACKSMIETRRLSRRALIPIERNEAGNIKGDVGGDHLAMVAELRAKIEGEVSDICQRIFNLLDSHLIPTSTTGESKVFCLKMKGDYHRYLSEFKSGAKEAAESSYKLAEEIARKELPQTHPIRLGLALNFSVFYCQTMNDPERASILAREALDGAICELDTLGDESWKESALIMKILHHNIILCTSTMHIQDERVKGCASTKHFMLEDTDGFDSA